MKKSAQKAINNMQIDEKNNSVLITINSKIYPLEIVYSAAYVFIDRAYVIIDGDPEDKLIVELKLKEKGNLDELGREFNNELVSYAVYVIQSARTQGVRDALVEKVFSTNTEKSAPETEDDEFEGMDYEEDPLGITKPWGSEKQGDDECK